MKLYKKLLLNTERGQTSEPALVNELLSLTQLNGIVFLWPSRALNLFISHQELIHNFPTHHGGRTDGAASWQRFSCTMCTGSVHERGTLRRLTFHKSQLIACDMHVVLHEETKRKDVRGRRSQTLSSNFYNYSSKVRVCSSLIPAAKWQIQGARVNISKGRGSLSVSFRRFSRWERSGGAETASEWKPYERCSHSDMFTPLGSRFKNWW